MRVPSILLLSSAFLLSLASTTAVAAAAPQAPYVDSHGRRWIQLPGTTGRTWTAVAAICPSDGLTPAAGSLGTVDVTGYVWARQADVRSMMAEFEPALLSAPTVSGPAHVLPALSFFSAFRPTFEYYTTFGGYNFISGWTSDEANGLGGLAAASAQYPVFDGSFDTASVADTATTNSFRGVWLYEPQEVGATVCSPAAPNSSGLAGELRVVGSSLLAHGDLVLHATGLPTGVAGIFVCSTTAASVPMAGGGQGTLCLGGAIGRFTDEVHQSGADGRFARRLDLVRLPTPNGSVAAQVGETWLFQAWYRDVNPVATSNFTSAVSITLL